MRKLRVTHLATVGFLATISCGDDTTGPAQAGPPTRLTIVQGDAQTAEIGTELPTPVRVRVLDAQGTGVPGQLVNFVVTKGRGRVFAGSALTNAIGEAVERWTLGDSAGEQLLEARAVNQTTGAPIVFGQIRATANPGPVTLLQLHPDPFVVLGRKLPVTALISRAWDRAGNTVAAPIVAITLSNGWVRQGDSLIPPSESLESGTVLTVTSGSATASTVAHSVFDLRRRWNARWYCGSLNGVTDDQGRRILSLRYSVTIDSAAYRGSPSHQGGDRAATLFFTGMLIRARADGADTVRNFRSEFHIARQRPDSLFFVHSSDAFAFARATHHTPRRYEGGTPCVGTGAFNPSDYEPFVMEEIP